MDVLLAIDQVISFMELPDWVVLADGSGAELGKGKGSDS